MASDIQQETRKLTQVLGSNESGLDWLFGGLSGCQGGSLPFLRLLQSLCLQFSGLCSLLLEVVHSAAVSARGHADPGLRSCVTLCLVSVRHVHVPLGVLVRLLCVWLDGRLYCGLRENVIRKSIVVSGVGAKIVVVEGGEVAVSGNTPWFPLRFRGGR